MTRKPYPSDVSDEEWAFLAPYLTLMPEDAGQRHYELREVYNALRWIVRTGASMVIKVSTSTIVSSFLVEIRLNSL